MDCYGTTIILTIHCSLSSSMNNQVLHRDTTDTSLSPSWPGKAWCACQHWAAPPHVFVDDFHGFGLGSQLCVFRFFFMFLGGGFNHLEKYEFVNGKDYPILWNGKKFETTNQAFSWLVFHQIWWLVILIKYAISWENSWSAPWYPRCQNRMLVNIRDEIAACWLNPASWWRLCCSNFWKLST